MSLLKIQDLNVQFYDGQKGQEVVRHLSFETASGEIVGIVGESGSGKSTAMKAVLGLLPGSAQVVCRRMELGGTDITPPSRGKGQKEYERRMASVRGDKIAMVFQNPQTSLNPTVKVGRQITETIRAHRQCSRARAKERALELLDMAGICDGWALMEKYPFELSGGMSRRVLIAAATIEEPRLVIADEPTPGLEKKTAKMVMGHFRELAEMGSSVLVITHDLELAVETADRILVMHEGRVAEEAFPADFQAEETLRHPYTKALWRAMPSHWSVSARGANDEER